MDLQSNYFRLLQIVGRNLFAQFFTLRRTTSHFNARMSSNTCYFCAECYRALLREKFLKYFVSSSIIGKEFDNFLDLN